MKKLAIGVSALLIASCIITDTPHNITFTYARSDGNGYYTAEDGTQYDTNRIAPSR